METTLDSQLAHQAQWDRVRAHTAPIVLHKIDTLARANVDELAERGDRSAIVERIVALEHEWDVDRALMLNFAVLGGIGMIAGSTRNRSWFWLLRAQLAFLGMHALVGWCPPLTLFRRLGLRTRQEIEAERIALIGLLSPAP